MNLVSRPLVLLASDFRWPRTSVIIIFTSSFETLYFKKRQKLHIFWLNIAKIGASWVVLELSQQLIFQLIHMGNRVTCIGVFNENIVCFWRFLRWTDQKWPKKFNNWPAGIRKISRQQYQWFWFWQCKRSSDPYWNICYLFYA